MAPVAFSDSAAIRLQWSMSHGIFATAEGSAFIEGLKVRTNRANSEDEQNAHNAGRSSPKRGTITPTLLFEQASREQG